MINWLSQFLDRSSNFLATRKGLLPLTGIGLILLNFVFVSIMPDWFFSRTNLLLHLGVILALIGQMLAWALLTNTHPTDFWKDPTTALETCGMLSYEPI